MLRAGRHGHRLVVSTHVFDGNELFDLVPPEMKYFVTGEIGCSGEGEQRQWQLTLSLWDCTQRTQCGTESSTVAQSELGALVLELEQRLLAKVGAVNPQPLDAFYARPSVDAMDIYLGELGQAFMLTLAANQQVPRSAVWGERTMPGVAAQHGVAVATGGSAEADVLLRAGESF